MSRSILDPKPLRLSPGFLFGGPIDCILPKKILESPEIIHVQTADPSSMEYWMLQALKESLLGIGTTNPNPSVGCVIVDRDGKEISRGRTLPYPGQHAEYVAFKKITDATQLTGATVYVTLEPCAHQGNQPPCVDLLLSSPIRKIVIARRDPNPLVNGAGIRRLQKGGKEVYVGVLHSEVTAWNFPFFASQTLHRPAIILKWAQTLDGQLADDFNHSQWITGPVARMYTHWLRQRYDSILVGAHTFLKDLPRLDVRDCAPPHQHHPLPIVFDPSGITLQLDEAQQKLIYQKQIFENRHWVFITTQRASKKIPSSWLQKSQNISLLTIPGNSPILELFNLFQGVNFSNILGRPFQSIFIEGGARTLELWLKSGYADLLHVFVAPQLTGGTQNRIQLSLLLKNSKMFELINSARLSNDMVLEMVPSSLAKQIFL